MTLAQALDPQVQIFWWATLGTGLVVAVVVVMLLQFLLVAVIRIENNVKVLWQTATTVARNTATSWMLNNTADGLEELKAEALRHDAMLSEALRPGEGAVRSRGVHS
jgi:cobalamin synthase